MYKAISYSTIHTTPNPCSKPFRVVCPLRGHKRPVDIRAQMPLTRLASLCRTVDTLRPLIAEVKPLELIRKLSNAEICIGGRRQMEAGGGGGAPGKPEKPGDRPARGASDNREMAVGCQAGYVIRVEEREREIYLEASVFLFTSTSKHVYLLC
ncbi:hypothetical protein L596_014489 [Steinernema carpocapsae]|uniref:Uncharacterized protein n=1 Tax=Steinernema carpocapsae TaxID=34508 RepID=A0A4U5NC34_STECR|nr:hypothetical protein L596_014489 [Steinernema carpocapsae]